MLYSHKFPIYDPQGRSFDRKKFKTRSNICFVCWKLGDYTVLWSIFLCNGFITLSCLSGYGYIL